MDCTLTLVTDGTTPFFQVQNSGPEPLQFVPRPCSRVTTAPDAPARWRVPSRLRHGCAAAGIAAGSDALGRHRLFDL
jgi:hypothetical protein